MSTPVARPSTTQLKPESPGQMPFCAANAETVRLCLHQSGYVHVTNVPDGFDYLALARELGPLVPQYDGQTVWSIKATGQHEDVYHSLNTREMASHTECVEFEGLPPRYLALWCLQPAADGGGHTRLADLYELLTILPEREVVEIACRHYEFASTPGLKAMNLARTASHPLLERRPGADPVFRFSTVCLKAGSDELAESFSHRLIAFAREHQLSFALARNDLLIWDNFRMAHWRTSFADPGRHLRRVWVSEQ